MQIQDGSLSGKLADWALSTISAMPPAQGVIAFMIVLVLGLPLIRAGMRQFRTPPRVAAPEPLIQQTPWLITILTKIDLQTQEARRDIDAIEQAIGHISREIAVLRELMEGIAKLLRSRKNRRHPHE